MTEAHSLGAPRRPRRVEHQPVVVGRGPRPRRGAGGRAPGDELLGDGDRTPRRRGREAGRQPTPGDQGRGRRVLDSRTRFLGRRVQRAEGHRQAPGAPDTEQRRHVRRPRLDQERDPGAPRVTEPGGHRRGLAGQRAVAEGRLAREGDGLWRMPPEPDEQRTGRAHPKALSWPARPRPLATPDGVPALAIGLAGHLRRPRAGRARRLGVRIGELGLDVEHVRQLRPTAHRDHLALDRPPLGQRLNDAGLDLGVLGAATQDVDPVLVLAHRDRDVTRARRGLVLLAHRMILPRAACHYRFQRVPAAPRP